MSKKMYGLYLAYHKNEVLPDEEANDPNVPNYPPALARVRIYDNPHDQMEAYANVPCPASQTFEADDKFEFDMKFRELQQNFLNEEWLEENIYPYI